MSAYRAQLGSRERRCRTVGLPRAKRQRSPPGAAESPVGRYVQKVVVVESASQEADTTTCACQHVYNHLKKAFRNNKKKPVVFFRFILHPTKLIDCCFFHFDEPVAVVQVDRHST
ncbi:hypothetical protein M514_16786, partial [Trichuris suis]